MNAKQIGVMIFGIIICILGMAIWFYRTKYPQGVLSFIGSLISLNVYGVIVSIITALFGAGGAYGAYKLHMQMLLFFLFGCIILFILNVVYLIIRLIHLDVFSVIVTVIELAIIAACGWLTYGILLCHYPHHSIHTHNTSVLHILIFDCAKILEEGLSDGVEVLVLPLLQAVELQYKHCYIRKGEDQLWLLRFCCTYLRITLNFYMYKRYAWLCAVCCCVSSSSEPR